MNGAFAALLPETAVSVRDLQVISEHVGVSSTLTVAVSGDERERVLDFAERLGEDLEAAKLPSIARVDRSLADFIRFIEQHRTEYLPLDALQTLKNGLFRRLEVDRRARDPFELGLDDPIVDAPTWQDLEQNGRAAFTREASNLPRYERGLFAHPTQNVAVIFLRTNVVHGDVARADRLLADIENLRAGVAEQLPGEIRVDFGGDLMDATHETKTLTSQMVLATLLTIVLVAAAILFFFRSPRAIPLLCGFLATPLALTLAFAALTVEYLNTSTAFLISIVIGNGINPGVMWLARYFEERRKGRCIEDALVATHLGSAKATFVASGAAALAYGSLVITDFRGFRDFGLIGGIGMIVCWSGALIILPALTVCSERYRPISQVGDREPANNPYGMAFRKIALAKPVLTLGVAGAITAVAFALSLRFVLADPLEYDFRKLTSLREPGDRITWVNARQSELAPETQVGSALMLLAPDATQVPQLVQQLKSYAIEHPGILGSIRTLDGLLPRNQAEKLPLLRELKDGVGPLLARASPEERARLELFLPAGDLSPTTAADLPDDVARTFRAKDGSLGRLFYVEHHPSQNRWDGEYWMQWVSAVRSIRTIDGQRVPSSGNPVLFADMLASLRKDAPLAMALSFSATLALITVSLRSVRTRAVTIIALLLGMLWMVGSMALLDLKLHFLNVLAFPIALGNGVDYAVNVVQRFETELAQGKDQRHAASVSITETGGAVVLCSLTTIFGYLSIHVSQNQALRSFAMAMAIAEWTCLIAAVVVLPAWLYSVGRSTVQRLEPERRGPA